MSRISKEARSRIMASIRGRDTSPEIAVRSFLHGAGFRFRVHKRICGVRPDVALPKYNAIIMIHGCFWHWHRGCPRAGLPKSRKLFWKNKFVANRRRDRNQKEELLEDGWRVATIWECSLEDGRLEKSLARLTKWIKGSRQQIEIG